MLILMTMPPLKGPAGGQEKCVDVDGITGWVAAEKSCPAMIVAMSRSSAVLTAESLSIAGKNPVPGRGGDDHDVTVLTRRSCVAGHGAVCGRSPLRGRRSRRPRHPRVRRARAPRPGRRTGSDSRRRAPLPSPGHPDVPRRTDPDHPYDTADRRGRGCRLVVRANASLVSHLREIKQWWSTEPGGPGMKAEGGAGPVDTPKPRKSCPMWAVPWPGGERAQALGQLLH